MSIKNRGLFPTIGDQFNRFGAWLLTQLASVKAFLFGQPEQVTGDGNDRIYHNVTVASVLISMLLFIISFVGSYTAARAFAEDNGIAPMVAGWIPVSIDGFIGLGILVIFGASLVGARVGWVKAVVLFCVTISVLFNVSHIVSNYKGWEHYLLGAVFPAIVFFSAEITSRQIRDYITRRGSLRTNTQLSAHNATLEAQQASLSAEIEVERAQLFTAAQQSVREAITELEEHRSALTSQVEAGARRLKKLNTDAKAITQQTGITVEDIQIALWIGQDEAISGAEIGNRLAQSQTTGGKKKKRVNAILNGGLNVNSDNRY